MKDTIYNLSNEDYHNSPPYSEYISSTSLKNYLRSPKYFKFMQDNPQPQTEAMRFGSIFHDLMECMAKANGDWDEGFRCWDDKFVLVKPIVNPKTNLPYGTTTQAYKKYLDELKENHPTRELIDTETYDILCAMSRAVVNSDSSTSEQVRKLLKWGKPEVSHFIEYEGCKFKWRPDLETGKKIIDWKTVVTNDLSEKSINNIISRYGYDISAAHYLFFEHERSGVWKTFYWLFVSKEPPYDAVLVDSSLWTYLYDPDTDIVQPGAGAIKFKRLLDLHIKCTKENDYPGAEINIPADPFGRRIMLPTPPPWEVNLASDLI